LDDGYLYIGDQNDDPETNPIQVFWDSALTIPATQPIRTNSGYAWRNGSPGLLYTSGPFSITIRNKRNEFVLYSPLGYGFDPASVSASVVKNDFVGDGVDTTFTLSATPSTVLATNAFINGVYQEKDSYSLFGNVITFSVAPPLGSSIEIMTNETGVINSGNATAISYTAGFAGATAQTVQTKLQQYVSVKDFGAIGNGVADDTAAFQAALLASTCVYVPPGDYIINAALSVAANGLLYGEGTIRAKSGFTSSFMLLAAAGSTVRGLSFDGTNMPVPTVAWTGAGIGTARAPIGSAIFVNGASGSEVAGITLDGLTFANFPSGPVCAFYADGLQIIDCKADTVQTYTGAETNGVYHVNYGAAPSIVNSSIDGFNWKGFYFAYTTQGTMVNCSAIGGVAGHSAHYVTYGSGNTLSACSQTGGFGFKCTNSEDVIVDAYVSLNSSNSGLYAYCSKNVVFSNCLVKQPAGRGVLITADSSFGPCQNILVTGCEVIYKTIAAGVNQAGVYIEGDATNGVEDVTIIGCKFWQPFFGVQVAAAASSTIAKLNIIGCTFYRPVQYGILGYVKSAVISNCNFDLNTAFPAGYLQAQTSVAGDDIVVVNNRSLTSSGSGVHWDIATGASAGSLVFDSLLFANNLGNGGNEFIKIAGNNATTDAVNNITLTGNVGVDLAAANPVLITANATTTTNCTTLTGNVLSGGSLRKNIRVVNSVNVTNKVDSGNNVNAVTYA
jgi:hypothetical protein